METKVKGRTGWRIAAVCFWASALFEILDVFAPVPLMGAIRSGIASMGYHLIFAAIFIVMGIALWEGPKWGYQAIMAGTALYSIDKAQMLLARQTFFDYLQQQFTTPTTRDIMSLVPKELLLQAMTVAYLLALLSWWGFAFYVHMRRSSFTRPHQ
jgi:hypothetical protein